MNKIEEIAKARKSVSSRERLLKMVDDITREDVFSVNIDTIKKIIKDGGTKQYLSVKEGRPFYQLSIPYDLVEGNKWNSTAEQVWMEKQSIYINLYVQYYNTDTNRCETWSKFFRKGEYCGEIPYCDKYGNSQTAYFVYDEWDKVRVIKSIIRAYVINKTTKKEIVK